VIGRGNAFRLNEGRFRLKKEIFYHDGGEALAQVAQRSCGCTLLTVFKARLDGALSSLV